jgi:hypothetical protein
LGVSRYSSQYLVDRHPLDQLHDEVRAALLRTAAVEHPGDVRVVHQGQRLPLRLEPDDDPLRLQPGPDDLERHLPLDGTRLLGHPDGAHAALADELQQLVRADPAARGVGGRRLVGRGRAGGGRVHGRAAEEAAGPVVGL